VLEVKCRNPGRFPFRKFVWPTQARPTSDIADPEFLAAALVAPRYCGITDRFQRWCMTNVPGLLDDLLSKDASAFSLPLLRKADTLSISP
jgi:hypothetical protein